MNNELKEKMTIGKAKKILRGFLEKDCYYDTPLYYAIPYLLDYITNLEEENNELLDKVRDRDKLIVENTQLKRDRIDKAIEYINNNKEHEYRNGNDNEFYLELNEKEMNNLLDILKGSDKE